MRTQIRNVTLLTMNKYNDIYQQATITIEDDHIIAINEEIAADIIIDGEGAICMPGMVNTHAHFSMIPFRSLQDDCPDRLRKFLLPLEEKAMTAPLAKAACKVAIAESLLAGVTTVLDMYYFPKTLASCYEEMNMRAVVAETILNQPSCDASEAHGGLAIARKFLPAYHRHPLITPAIAPHSPVTNSKAALQEAMQLAEQYDTILTMHVSEMDYEMDYFQKQYQMTPVAYLDSIGMLNEHCVLGHAIHVTDEDCALIKKRGARIAHCIGSNTKAGKGIAPVKMMLAHGIPVGLGTDGPASGNTLDLFTQMNLFAKCHKVANHDRSLFPAKEIVELATLSGAKVLHLDHAIGSLEVGKKADIVLVETKSVNMFPLHDPMSALVYSANASNVSHVFVNGVQVVRNKQLVLQDLDKLIEDCRVAMDNFTKEARRLEQSL